MTKKVFTMYIAYGSNLNIEQMKRRCPTAIFKGRSILRGWRLQFRGVATIVPDAFCQVPIGLWFIDDEAERALDIYEGFPTLYRKEMLPVAFEGKEYEAIVYTMNSGRIDPPSLGYFHTIKIGYEDFNLDMQYLKDALVESYMNQPSEYCYYAWANRKKRKQSFIDDSEIVYF